jgi:hypothetical protein
MLVNTEESDVGLIEDGETYTPISGLNGVRITQRIGGYAGTVHGWVYSGIGKTADQWAALLLAMREARQHDFVLQVGRESFHCAVFNVSVRPQMGPDAMREVTFDFIQTDYGT